MCTTCHGGADATTANNFNQIPSRKSCGACHDGIKWDTGAGSTLADKMKVVYAADALPSSGHVGGAAQDDDSVQGLPHGRRHQDRPPHGEHHQEQPGDHRRTGLVPLRDQVGHGQRQPTRSRSSSASGRRSRPSTTESLVTFVPAAPAVSNPLDRLHGWAELPAALCAEPRTASRRRWTTTTSGARQRSRRSVSVASLLSTNNAANGTHGAVDRPTRATTPPRSRARQLRSRPAPSCARWPCRATSTRSRHRRRRAAANARHAISVIKPVTRRRGTPHGRRLPTSARAATSGSKGTAAIASTRPRSAWPATCRAWRPAAAASPSSLLNTWNFNIARDEDPDGLEVRQDAAVNAALKFPVDDQQLQGHDPRHPRRPRTGDAVPGRA